MLFYLQKYLNLFEILIFWNIYVFTVIYDRLNAFLLIKQNNFLKIILLTPKL